MSVLVTVKIKGDTVAFRQALADRAGEFEKISAASRAQGAIHHRFGLGDGFVLVVDEWESPGHFEQFFSNPDLQGFIASVGAAAEPPEITVAETVASADQF
jgi:quinol monooxygenase YgiN